MGKISERRILYTLPGKQKRQGKESSMRKKKTVMAAGAVMLVLSACGQEAVEESQKDKVSLVIENIDDTDEAQNAQYEAFLHNETSVANPYVEGMNLTVMDEKNYESEFEDAKKKYAYVDVNNDDNPELIFKMSSETSELMYILGICDDELVCFDVFESHTRSIDFGVYDYGLVWEMWDYDGFEMTFYSYTTDGQPMEARRFTEENEADLAAYEGKEPDWIDL